MVIRIPLVLLRESTMISPEFKTEFTPGEEINGTDIYVCNLILQAMCQPSLKYYIIHPTGRGYCTRYNDQVMGWTIEVL
jgi:hypothetical protein